MNTVTVFVAKALVCLSDQCYPALTGPETPVGEYRLMKRYVTSPGYGKDGLVLQFKETKDAVYAIHRVYELDRKIDRKAALRSPDPAMRRVVSNGCVNVSDDVFDRILRGSYRAVVVHP